MITEAVNIRNVTYTAIPKCMIFEKCLLNIDEYHKSIAMHINRGIVVADA